jgi:hypothetical protein
VLSPNDVASAPEPQDLFAGIRCKKGCGWVHFRELPCPKYSPDEVAAARVLIAQLGRIAERLLEGVRDAELELAERVWIDGACA